MDSFSYRDAISYAAIALPILIFGAYSYRYTERAWRAATKHKLLSGEQPVEHPDRDAHADFDAASQRYKRAVVEYSAAADNLDRAYHRLHPDRFTGQLSGPNKYTGIDAGGSDTAGPAPGDSRSAA